MNLGLTPEQQMLVDSVRAFVAAELAPHEDVVERSDEGPPASMPPTCPKRWAAAGSTMSGWR